MNVFPRKIPFTGATAKTRVTELLGRDWARLIVMDGLVPFDPQDEHTSAHAWDDKKNYLMVAMALINQQRLMISFTIYVVNDKSCFIFSRSS